MTGKVRAPLRAIVSYVDVEIAPGVTQQRERLECGHVVRIKRDIIGETNAYRRRCKACANAVIARIIHTTHVAELPSDSPHLHRSDVVLQAGETVRVLGSWEPELLELPGQHVEVEALGRRVWVQRCNLAPMQESL